jgi:hypothetical protein
MPAAAKSALDRARRARHDVERRVRPDHHDRAALGAVDLHVLEHRGLRGEQRAQPLGIGESGADPLHEDPLGRETRVHESEEFAGIEMGRTGGPGMARLRDDRVEAAVGEHERAARVAEPQRGARIRERIAAGAAWRGAVRGDHLGLELDHVDRLDRARHRGQRHAGAEPDDQHVRGVRPHEHGQQRQPLRGRRIGRVALGLDVRLGQTIVGQAPAHSLIDQRHRRGATDREIAERALVVAAER